MDVARAFLACFVSTAILACAPNRPSADPAPILSGQAPPSVPQRTLVIIARGEPPTIAARTITPFSGSLSYTARLFNAALDYNDEREQPVPYLAEALPQLNTSSWEVFPDGTMQTTYRLRPAVSWHDGQPLTAEDFVFGWRVYRAPEFIGAAGSAPVGSMAEVAAPDPSTVMIRWARPYPDAAAMDVSFQALPRHLLEQPFRDLDSQAFSSLPFWTSEYVGLGPYRVDQWTLGSSIGAQAFEGHVLGRPKIDRVHVSFVGDPNTALATMLSGDAQYLSESILYAEEGSVLEREWGPRNGGMVLYSPVVFRITEIQFRPDYVDPRGLLDVRVRRALVHGMDVESAFSSSTGGKGLLMRSLTPPGKDYYAEVEPSIMQYAYDARRTQQLLEEVGLTKGTAGFFTTTSGDSFRVEVATDGGTTNERENAIFVESLRRAGVEASSHVVPVAQLRDAQARALLSGLSTGGLPQNRHDQFTSASVPRPENRWQGNNRGGWENADYDRVWTAFSSTLDRAQRVRQMAQMNKIFTETVAAIPHFYSTTVTASVAELQGPVATTTPDGGRGILKSWEWAWRR